MAAGDQGKRHQYATALGYLVMASASLEEDIRTLIGILLGPPYGTASHVLLRRRRLHGLCEDALSVAKLDMPSDLVDRLEPLLSQVKSAATKRNDLMHSAFRDWTDSWQKAPEIIQAIYDPKTGGTRLDEKTVAEIEAVTEEVKRAGAAIRTFAFGEVLPLTDPNAATPHTNPLS